MEHGKQLEVGDILEFNVYGTVITGSYLSEEEEGTVTIATISDFIPDEVGKTQRVHKSHITRIERRPQDPNERILCAAIWYKDGQKHESQPINITEGFVIAGRRHHNCYATAKALAGLDETIKLKITNMENTMTKEEYRRHQGFITSNNRYVDRREAYKIAKAQGQIKFGADASDNGEDSVLISENLY